MSKITLDIPQALNDLPGEERDLLIHRALRSATKVRIEQIEDELRENQDKLDHFVKKYNMDLDTFERKVEAEELTGTEVQEDYHTWYFWCKSTQRAESVLQNLRRFLEP